MCLFVNLGHAVIVCVVCAGHGSCVLVMMCVLVVMCVCVGHGVCVGHI